MVRKLLWLVKCQLKCYVSILNRSLRGQCEICHGSFSTCHGCFRYRCQLSAWVLEQEQGRAETPANQQKAFHVSEKSVFVSTGFVYHSSLTGSFWHSAESMTFDHGAHWSSNPQTTTVVDWIVPPSNSHGEDLTPDSLASDHVKRQGLLNGAE